MWRRIGLAAIAWLSTGCGSTEPDREDAFVVTGTLLEDSTVVATRVTYRSDGLRVGGLICRPKAQGKHPLLMLNHGGWGGLTNELVPASSACLSVAKAGFVVIEPSYRGEDGSEGQIELCLGEATDIRTMLTLALDEPDVDQTKVAVLGGSHGGCSTLRALIDGAPPVRVVAVAGPTNWAFTYRAMMDSIAAGATGSRLAFFEAVTADTRRFLGGSPEQVPEAYAKRSLLSRVAALDQWSGSLLIQHGVDDDIVTVEESCALVALARGFTAFHVTGDGAIGSSAPPACAGYSIAWSAGPLPTVWSGRRYLVVYDGLGHGGGPNVARQGADALAFLYGPLPGGARSMNVLVDR